MSAPHIPLAAQTRGLVNDLFEPNPVIYWLDFLTTMVVAYGAATIFMGASLYSMQQVVAYLVAGCALYRLASFMHEIVHFRSSEMRGFRVAWNILAGIPMLTPTFFYQSHIDHHNARHYGTEHDGEYLPLGTGRLSDLVLFLVQILAQPILVTLRFLLAPVTFLHPRLRNWTLERVSSFVIDFRYRRPIPNDASRRAWAWIDLACSLRAWAIFIFIFAGVTDWTRIPQLYSLAVLALGLNHLRTLAAHRYLCEGHQVSHDRQVSDSTNVTGVPLLTELLFPLGMRYHGLHHLFPRLPYHNLGTAHRRLMQSLPDDSPYRKTVYPSWRAVVQELFINAANRTRSVT